LIDIHQLKNLLLAKNLQITLKLLFGFQRPAVQPDGQHTQINLDCQYLFSVPTIFFSSAPQNFRSKRDSLSIINKLILSKEICTEMKNKCGRVNEQRMRYRDRNSEPEFPMIA
jgi:hypothetical protein